MIGSPKYVVRFSRESNSDTCGHFFTHQTDYGNLKRLPIIFDHGTDPIIGKTEFGHIDVERDQLGYKVAGFRFDTTKSDAGKTIVDAWLSGNLSWSTGSVNHNIIELKSGRYFIDKWVPHEASLTPRPAEPWLTQNPLFPPVKVNGPSPGLPIKGLISPEQWMQMQLERRAAYIEELQRKMKSGKLSHIDLPDPQVHTLGAL